MQRYKNVPFLLQLSIFLIQLAVFLLIDWLDVRHHQQLPISDAVFWSVTLPITWLIYTSVSYYYSHKLLSAMLQGLIQTLVSYTVVVAIMLFFHQWIGGSF